MKRIVLAAVAAAFAAASVPALADPRDDHRDEHHEYRAHPEWSHGQKIGHDDWGRGRPVDWRSHHLRRPPRGYEWREVDGNWVLAAAATGLIASIIANAH